MTKLLRQATTLPAADISTPSSPVSPDAYRAAMRFVPAAVTIITARHDGERNGLTATAVASVSADPPQLLICVNRQASAEPLIAGSSRFAVNVLAHGHRESAERFSRSTLSSDERFDAHRWIELPSGVPALADAIAVFECRIAQHSLLGTHSLFIGEVVGVSTAAGEPLLYHDGRYRLLADLSPALPTQTRD
jgi:flavin reductase (DIM6/NTAB) family NADH-FMN oxidoreductase RutF